MAFPKISLRPPAMLFGRTPKDGEADGSARRPPHPIGRRIGSSLSLSAVLVAGTAFLTGAGLITKLSLDERDRAIASFEANLSLAAEDLRSDVLGAVDEGMVILRRGAQLGTAMTARDIEGKLEEIRRQFGSISEVRVFDVQDGAASERDMLGSNGDAKGLQAWATLSIVRDPARPELGEQLAVSRSIPLAGGGERQIQAVIDPRLFEARVARLIAAGQLPETALGWVATRGNDVFLTLERQRAEDLQFYLLKDMNAPTEALMGPDLYSYKYNPGARADGGGWRRGEDVVVARQPIKTLPLTVLVTAPIRPALAIWWQETIMLVAGWAMLAAVTGVITMSLAGHQRALSTRSTRLATLHRLFARAEAAGQGGSWHFDGRRRRLYTSAGVMAWLGYEAQPQSFDVDDIRSLLHPDDQETAEKALAMIAGGTNRLATDLRLKRADGTFVWARVRAHIAKRLVDTHNLPKLQEKPAHLGQLAVIAHGILIEATQEREVRMDQARSEKRLREALERMSDAYALWDTDGRLLLCNGSFRALPSVTRSFALETLNSPADIETDEKRWVRVRAEELSDGSVVALGSDITDIKKHADSIADRRLAFEKALIELDRAQGLIQELSRQVDQQRREAAEVDRAKRAFLGTMSHELRTPLNAILGFSEIINNDATGKLSKEHYRDYAADIYVSGKHLLDLVNDLLDMSMLEAGRMKLDPDEISPEDVIEASVKGIRAEAMGKGIEIDTKIKDAPTIYADFRALKKVLACLLGNAVKFSPEGTRVTLAVAKAGRMIAFSVVDHGRGMDKKDLERIGQPFNQVEESIARPFPGLGLGLSIAQRYVALHGGQFDIQSEKGKGTTVTFTVPRFMEDFPHKDRPAITRTGTDDADRNFAEIVAQLPPGGTGSTGGGIAPGPSLSS